MIKQQDNPRFNFHKIAFVGWFILGLVISENIFAGSLYVSWDPVQASGVAGYKIKYGTAPASYFQSINVGTGTSYTLQNLTEGSTYYLIIVAYDSNLVEGAPSTEASGVVLKASNISAAPINSTSTVISWQTNKPSDSQVDFGTSTSYGSSTPLDSTLAVNHTQTLTNLSPMTTYNYRVRSKDEGGSITNSTNYTFTTTGTDLTILSLSPSQGDIGTVVVISGTGFGNLKGTSTVTFAGVPATASTWANTSITAAVPPGARSGPVLVTVNGVQSNGITFKVGRKLAPPRRVRLIS